MARRKFSEWVDLDLPTLPGGQLVDTDKLIVIRGGAPFSVDPIERFAYGSFAGNALVTTINTVDVWEAINGVLVDDPSTINYTLAASVYTHDAVDMLRPTPCFVSASFFKDGGGSAHNYEIGVFVNGSLVGGGMIDNGSSSLSGNAAAMVLFTLNNGDTVAAMIRNRTGNNNVLVTDLQLRIG